MAWRRIILSVSVSCGLPHHANSANGLRVPEVVLWGLDKVATRDESYTYLDELRKGSETTHQITAAEDQLSPSLCGLE